ncbi:MAG TPA: hypothetical protein PKJ77_00145 [Thermodesulfobacteriota bacterium]|nr:hypothetical protein [Deltaproteobacteria bacterium]HNR13029.1 hypothetical protein [Thermodesulfobacteriota bacterium]HOC37669.1 hypothetical protein [Thermodesulfobacteriota bacterium]
MTSEITVDGCAMMPGAAFQPHSTIQGDKKQTGELVRSEEPRSHACGVISARAKARNLNEQWSGEHGAAEQRQSVER